MMVKIEVRIYPTAYLLYPRVYETMDIILIEITKIKANF